MKSWTDKFKTPGINGIKPSPRSFSDVVEGRRRLAATGRQVDDLIRSVPVGARLDVRTSRREPPRRHGAEVSCLVTTGDRLGTTAEAAREGIERDEPAGGATPLWRALDRATRTTGRLSSGQAFGAERRRRQGLPE